MKPYLRQKRNVQGSVLLMALGATFVLGLGLASYLTLTRWQHVSTVRSQAWNAALGLAEAGVEEALAQLNPAARLFTTNVNRGANGWTLLSDGMYHAPRRTLPSGYYEVAISSDLYPRICSTGYVTIRTLSATVARAVTVTTVETALFRAALAARVDIDLKGNKVATDSFDSMDPLHSTNGLYYAPWRKANGDVASTDGIINVQNADIRGTIYTGPAGGYSIGPEGTVGDLSWPLAGGLQPGHYKNDFNMDFPDVLPPYETAVPPASGTFNGTNYTWMLGEGDYMCTAPKGVDLKTGDEVLVTGKARVYVTGDFIMSGSSKIIIAPGASLQLYVGGAKASITSVNNAGNCATFGYFGLPSNTALALTGNDLFLGTIYTPNAEFTLGGGGNTTVDFQGACAVNTIKMNGHFNFHYDENLRRKGPSSGYRIASWNEI